MPESAQIRVGLAGFSHDQQELLRRLLADAGAAGPAEWKLGELAGSDVLFVNGARTQSLGGDAVRIASGVPGGRSVQIALSELDRPVAVARPFPSRGIASSLLFDLGDATTLHAVLDQLLQGLQPLLARHVLASQVLEQDTSVGSGVWHVTDGATVLAVVDLRGDVALAPQAGARDLGEAVWIERPRAALDFPAGYERRSLSLLMWDYALRTRRDVLPPRYRQGMLFFRRPPRLPHRLLQDGHLLLLRELAHAPTSFEQLGQRTGLSADLLARDLGALYLVGAVTANPKRAAQHALARRPGRDSGAGALASVVPSDLQLPAGRLPPAAYRPEPLDHTVPARLEV
jgi:hypothetical protein